MAERFFIGFLALGALAACIFLLSETANDANGCKVQAPKSKVQAPQPPKLKLVL